MAFSYTISFIDIKVWIKDSKCGLVDFLPDYLEEKPHVK